MSLSNRSKLANPTATSSSPEPSNWLLIQPNNGLTGPTSRISPTRVRVKSSKNAQATDRLGFSDAEKRLARRLQLQEQIQ